MLITRSAVLAGLVLAASVGVAQTPAQELAKLNLITGESSMQGLLQELVKDKARAKKLIAEGVTWTKEKEKLSYNLAYVLGLVAGEEKDLASCEKLLRVCTDAGARMQSPRRLIQAYGVLIEVFYENRKYQDSARICTEFLNLKTEDDRERVVKHAVPAPDHDIDFVDDGRFDVTKNVKPGVKRLLVKSIAKLGKHDQALKLTDEIIQDFDHWQERQLKAWVLHEAGKFEGSAKAYEDVVERISRDRDLEPDEREVYVERMRYIMSSVYVDMKRIDKAGEVLQTLLANKPENPSYNNDLGYIWADNDMNLETAEKMVLKALEIDRKLRKSRKVDPEDDHDNGAYLDSLAWVYYKQKRYPEAKKVMLEALKDKSSQHIEIYDHLGDICWAMNEKEEAFAAWRKGLEHVTDSRRDIERKKLVEEKLKRK